MSDDVLLEFVNKNLIQLGGDDTKLEKLRQAAADLSSIIQGQPTKTIAFSLAAFDPEVPETDPAVLEAASTLRQRWETYANTFAPTPVAVCRAMLMAGLVQAARDNEAVAVGFSVSARNVLPFMEVGGEQEIWTKVVADVETAVEARAEAEWATPSSIELPKIKLDPISFEEIVVSGSKVDRNSLAKTLLAAAGPNFVTPQDGNSHPTEGNPHFPDQREHWVYEFGRRAAAAAGGAIDTTVEGLSVDGGALSEATAKLGVAISNHLATTLRAVSNAMVGLQRRTDLLWWKEALFSPSARRSYRDFQISEAAALMAFDLYRQIPSFSPASTAAFLQETVMVLPKFDGDHKTPIRALVEGAARTQVLAELRTEAARLVTAPAGRGPLLGLIGHPEILSHINDQKFRDLFGIKQDSELSLPAWSTWLLRELQAARTLSEASTPKRNATTRKRSLKR